MKFQLLSTSQYFKLKRGNSHKIIKLMKIMIKDVMTDTHFDNF